MARKLSPGHLKHRITIEASTNTADGRGGVTKAWATHATVWARVTPLSARESFQAGQVQGSVSHRVVCRYTASVRPAMRVVWGSRVFVITGVRNRDEDNLVLELECTEERV